MNEKNKLAQYLVDKKLTDQAFAELADCERSTISKIRTGDRLPGLEVACKIERATRGKIKATYWLEAKESA